MNDPKNAAAAPVPEQAQPPRPEQQPTSPPPPEPSPQVPPPHRGQEDKDRQQTSHRREGVVSDPD